MHAVYIKDDESKRGELHFEHAIDRGVGYGQLWFDGRWHLEFTRDGLLALAREATELAEGL